jgi:hypothetical protein
MVSNGDTCVEIELMEPLLLWVAELDLGFW